MTVKAKKVTPKRRATGEGGLFQRADLMWCGVADVPTEDGRRRQKWVYSMDYEKARNKLDDLKDDIKNGVVPSASTTVAHWLTYWLEEIKGPHVRPNTRQFYEEAIRIHIIPAIGKKRLDKLTPTDVRGMINGIATGRNRQRAHQVLGLALKDAIKDGRLRRNVVEAVAKPPHLAAVRGAFTADQAKTIIRAAIAVEESRDATAGVPALATRWAAAFLSGARKGELCGLEWSRVDLDAGLFDFAWQLQQLKKVHGCGEPSNEPPDEFRRNDRKPKGPPFYPCQRARAAWCPKAHWDFNDDFEYRECSRSLVFTRPKTATGTRIVPILPGLLEMLKHHAKIDEPNPHGLVWHHTDGRPISPTDDHEAWQALLVSAGITEKGTTIPLHSARHSTATLLQEAGVPEEVRMKIMGQSSVAAHRGYIHVDQTQARTALSNLAELLG